jgi:hypothetical protein
MHAFRRVNKCPKRVAGQSLPRVHERNESSDVPAIPRIGERDQSARPLGRAAEQTFGIGVTTDDAIERDDVGIGKRGRYRGEIADDESRGTRPAPTSSSRSA